MYLCLNRGTTGGGLSQEEFAQLASGAGFPGADINMDFAVANGAQAMVDLFGRLGLKLGGWGPPDWRGESADAVKNLEVLKKQAPVAGQLGAVHAATWIMPSSELPLAENFSFHVARLKPVAAVLADSGIGFGLEFVSPYHLRFAHRHEFLFTPGQMLELADAIGPNVGLLVDCFHLHCAGVPASFVAEKARGRVMLAHLNDAPKVPVHEVLDGTRVFPGEGAIDQSAYRAALAAAGYQGPVSLEVFNRVKDLPALEAAKAAREACRLAGW
jgi:sugar phosphate isomerase/epimerase